MFNSSGIRTALVFLTIALIMGVVGFAVGFVVRPVLIAAEPAAASVLIEITTTPSPTDASPHSPPPADTQAPPEPTSVPLPTIVPGPSDEEAEAFDLFWEAWHLIERDFYGDLPSEEDLIYGAIRGATNLLDDPYTAFIEPVRANYRRQIDSGSYSGIGAFVAIREGHLVIVQPMEDHPAEKAGLRPDDVVLKVDDTSIENMSLYEAIALILGPEGTQVRLTILREGHEPFEVEITRATIETPVVESEMLENGIAYVHLFGFSTDASVKLANRIRWLLEDNPDGLILDLRGNPGGYLREAVLTAGLFLPENELVLIERFKDGTERPYLALGSPINTRIPMVVLVDGGSASGSEIVAGALQDHGRAVLVGEKSFGKGSVQLPHELSNGAELRVTIARWFTPNDRPIHGEGLEPDIVVELTPDDAEADLDPQFDRAVEYLLTGE
jgi:carboxyl-terminal processing protease